MVNENHMNGILQKYGWFKSEYVNVVKLSGKIDESDPFYDELVKSGPDTLVADKVFFKNTLYNCVIRSCILVHDSEKRTSFSIGILTKIILKNKSFDSHGGTLSIFEIFFISSDFLIGMSTVKKQQIYLN